MDELMQRTTVAVGRHRMTAPSAAAMTAGRPRAAEEPVVDEAMLAGAVTAYDIGPDPAFTLVEVSENVTCRVDDGASGRRWALRLHRPGYHTREEILGELAWIRALRAAGAVATPPVVATRSGELVATLAGRSGGGSGGRHAVLFEWVDGRAPEPADAGGLVGAFTVLGEIAARLHRHARGWRRPAGFARFAWTFDTMLGPAGRWGRWSDGMRTALAGPAGADGASVVTRAAAEIERRLAGYGTGPERFGLVHADMRLANLLVTGGGAAGPGSVCVIDFDDCGFGWYMYDLAASLSFIEHLPAAGELVDAWLAGYRTLAPVAAADAAMVPTLVMLRRLLLVAWLGTHPHSGAVGDVAAYAAGTCALADAYLAGRLLAG
jgi:Ser/Thr protein kinase RdoA (MazF antagonist)